MSPAALFVEACGVVAAIGTFVWVRYSSRAPHDKSDAGLWLMLLNSADIALLETWATDPDVATRRTPQLGRDRHPASPR